MSFAYHLGQSAAARQLGLTKEAGLRDALRVALTGRVPLRHGTSASRAGSILEKGLQPGAASGISGALDDMQRRTGMLQEGTPGLEDLQQGLTFATRDKATAKRYGGQQQALEDVPQIREQMQSGIGKLQGLADKYLPNNRGAKDLLGQAARFGEQAPAGQLAQLMAPHTKGQILDLDVPRSFIRGQETHSPEATRMVGGIQQTWKALGKDLPAGIAENAAGLPFMRDAVIKGAVPPQYIKGSPHYQGVGMQELKEHASNVVKDPREYMKDIGRALTGISHRPTKITGGL